MLPPLTPLDRQAALVEVEAALAAGREDQAIQVLGRDPLAVFSWLLCDGAQAAYLFREERAHKVYGGLALLFARWVEAFRPEGPAEELAARALRAQVAYLRHVFGRLAALDPATRDAAREAHRRMTRAGMARDLSRSSEALAEFQAAFEGWREAEEPYFQAQAAADWAALLEREGELDGAADKLELAVHVALELGDLERLGRRRLHQGKVALQRGRPAEALHEYREAAGVFHVTREAPELVTALVAEAEVLTLIGRAEEARPGLDAALAAARASGDPDLLLFVHRALGAAGGPASGPSSAAEPRLS